MSDKSFGDHANRNIVKNPLLSTAVTGLSLEDLTHNAVLLPVAHTQELTARQDQQIGLQNVSLAQPESYPTDPNSNIHPPTPNPLNLQNAVKPEPPATKTAPKSEDDFDVNEYFARLQGTRYVSAPLNSTLKEDPTPEENLEEINLNEPDAQPPEVQQSLTADIAQNFSQLPTVLPQVASAVFSSFSNMLYKSREVTPDERKEVQERGREVLQMPQDVGVQLMGVDELPAPREVAPPPKEPPIVGTTNYRITTKKKAYAQIPGLSSQLPPQNIGDAQSYNPPPTFTPPSYLTPDTMVPQPPMTFPQAPQQTPAPAKHEEPSHTLPDFNILNPIETHRDDTQPIVEPTFYAVNLQEERKPEQMLETQKPPSVQGAAAIIPPPPMFSNQKKDSLTGVGKAVLPPSVARRIAGHHPIIKHHTSMQAPAFPANNIFVPAPISDNVLQNASGSDIPNRASLPIETSKSEALTDQPPPQNLPSAFVQFKSTYSSISSMNNPYNEMLVSEVHGRPYSHQNRPPVFPPSDERLSSPPSAGVRLPTPNEVVRLPSPNQTTAPPPSFFNPGNLSSSLSAVNAPRCKSIESVIASNTANLTKMSAGPPPTFFNPANMPIHAPAKAPNPPPPTGNPENIFNPETAQSSVQPPPTIFNPNPVNADVNKTDPIFPPQNLMGHYFDQTPTAESMKPVPEPPKLTGGLNYRMTKKRPQYYSGPIEGVGAISNNVKPVIPGLETAAFQGALFTPDQPVEQQALPEQSSTPFDLSKPAEMTSSYTPFAINSQINNQAQSYVQSEYDTAFDLSRPTTDAFNSLNYEVPKQESKGFGIIGSLKSKLSSIDINKIQNSVTTFFDPIYNDMKKEPTGDQGNSPYDYNQGYGYPNQESNLEIYVPNVEQHEGYGSQNQYQNIYGYGAGHEVPGFPPGHNSGYGHDPPKAMHQYHHHHYSKLPPGGQLPKPENILNFNPPPLDLGVGIVQSQPDMTNEIPSARHAFDTQQSIQEKFDDKIEKEVSLEQTENKMTGFTTAPAFDDSNYGDYNLFGNTAKITPADIESKELSKPGLDPTSALSFFDNQQFGQPQIPKSDFINKAESLQMPKNHSTEDSILIAAGKTFDETLDFSVDLIQPSVGIKSSSDIFGFTPLESKGVDFIQNRYGCGLVKTEDDDEISKDVEKVVDETIGLVLNDDKESIPKVDMSAVPLFGLSSILAEKTKEITNLEDSMQNVTLGEGPTDLKTRIDNDTSVGLLDTLNTTAEPITDEENLGVSDLNICETCREIEPPEEKDVDDLTVKLIENITSPIQLSNPVAAVLTETNTPVDDRTDFDSTQCAEISHITEETIETIQVQSATELLDDVEDITNANTGHYGWSLEDKPFNSEILKDHNYTFQMDPNALGFFGNNPMFFDNIPNNASDEIKAEYKSTQEDTPATILPRQMSIPSAPPAEDDDSKSDETGGLDVLSIEQDAKKDFPLFEEFVIEPSETDDDKIEYREKERSSEDPVAEVDSFTNRVERFKKMEETVEKHDDVFEQKLSSATSPPITIASYFDTGNYAAEVHYRNLLSSPTSAPFTSSNAAMRIPPGFEDEYTRKLSGVSAQDIVVKDEDANVNTPPEIPDTSTQTRPVITSTYSQVSSSPVTVTSTLGAKPPTEKLPEFSSVFGRNHESGDSLTSSIFGVLEDKKEIAALKKPDVAVTQESLPDPISFFSAEQESATTEAPDSGFNRLASYFQTPAKTDHAKSFFELSQSQNHYRHALDNNNADSNQIAQNSNAVKDFFDKNDNNTIPNIPTDVYVANLQLMNDLTSVQNIAFPKDQIVRTVNYFTIEYDSDDIRSTVISDVKGEVLKETNSKLEETIVNDKFNNDDELLTVITKCVYCCNVDSRKVVTLNKVELDSVDFKFKKAMDSDTVSSKDSGGGRAEEKREDRRREVAVTFGPLDEESEAVAMVSENRTTTEYSPVKHHWFYRVDFEGKSIWRGFSANDNRALEDAYHSPDLSENTLVPTDGGRFDVNVIGRLRIAVYWADKPTNVRRCSWFYKGATDARYVPYTETVAEKLEEEYRHGVTTGEWHRRLVLPNNESVVMHGPGVMVHFPQTSSDAFSSTPLFAFSKRVYRNPPAVRVSRDQRTRVDHLLLLVHGAGEYRTQREKLQSTMRPRVVRRGCDETEIEDPEPSSIDHLLLLCHGVGSACDMRFRSVEEVVDDFRSTSLQLLQSHYRDSYDKGVVNRVEVLPISWHATLHSGETGVDKRLAAITLDSIPKLRHFTNDTVLDVLFYTSPVFCQTIIDTVCAELNRIYQLFTRRNPLFTGQVSLGGHSLGSVILYDLLCHQANSGMTPNKSFVTGSAGSGQPSVVYPSLTFQPASLYALGSPIAMFECIRGVKFLGAEFALPTCRNFFNIFHPYDPIAYRIEPLINAELGDVKPFLIPHHKGRKRMHLELKDTMARVGADLKQKLVESLKATWSSMWKTPPPPHDGQLEQVVEEELDKEQLCVDTKSEDAPNSDVSEAGAALSAGRLNAGRRVDYVLQEAPFEMINEYLFAMSSHVCYWESEDTMLLILREIYDALGVPPDCTVPQQSMTVQRTRPQRQEENETIVLNATEHPSTSHGGT